MKKRLMIIGVAVAALSLVAAGCGDDDDDASAGGDSCEMGDLALKQDGKLTAATGEPVFPPWMMDDDPSNQMGFESAVVYAVADEMGFEAADEEWVRTGFDEAIAPGSKSYDFNIQQYTITAERDEVVDFSRSYYSNEQSIIALEGSDIIGAASIADLRSANLGGPARHHQLGLHRRHHPAQQPRKSVTTPIPMPKPLWTQARLKAW